MEAAGDPCRPEAPPPSTAGGNGARPLEIPMDPMEFLSRSWSVSTLEVSKALAANPKEAAAAGGFPGGGGGAIPEDDIARELELEAAMAAAGNSFSFAASATSQLVMERIMSQSQEVSPRTSGRLSHSSGPLTGAQSCGSLTDSPPVSPSDVDDANKYHRAAANPAKPQYSGGSKTVGRWLKDRREKKKEETRTRNAQLHAAVAVAGVAAAVAAVAAAAAVAPPQGGGTRKDDQAARTDMTVASAATLVAAQCVEAAEAMGAERDHLASVVSSAVNVRTPGDIITLTAAAATALRAAATLKARTLKEVWNIAAVIPVEKGGIGGNGQHNGHHHHHHHHRLHHHHRQQQEQQQADDKDQGFCDDLVPEENFLGLCSQELLARGTELLKRTRKDALHWKIVSVYVKRGQVVLKMKSKLMAGTITKKKKSVVIDVCKDISAWPGRHLLDGGEQRRYFGLKTVERRVIEFECRSQREYEIWTQGVTRLLNIAANKKFPA